MGKLDQHLDKWKARRETIGDEVHVVDSEGCHYMGVVDFFQGGVLGFCACAWPEGNLAYVRDGLAHIGRHTSEMPFEEWKLCLPTLFGTEAGAFFFFYWADAAGLSEHGSSIPGWLTEKGKDVLAALTDVLLEEELT